jgi:hypothetical protein
MNALTTKTIALSVSACLALAGAFYAGVAYAADARLDQASDFITKADALLAAAENPGKGKFGGHRAKARADLKSAQKQIAEAKKWADAHPPKAN